MSITYRAVSDPEILQRVVDLEMIVWDLDPRDAVPTNILHAMIENGTLLLVAECADQTVGLSLAFPARRGKETYLWSHMTGVHPEHQGKGIGLQLKLLQRKWALKNGYRKIGWTFDPLQRGNANFNVHLLGATANIYHVNYYGEMDDGINAGLPSDRLEVTWKLKGARPPIVEPTVIDDETFGLRGDSNQRPQLQSLDCQTVYLEIPTNLARLKQHDMGLALAWRMALREAMQGLFAQGYTLVDFVHVNGRHAYVLNAPVPWYMYVVECADGSFYTGVTLDIDRRIKQHNAGKGASYTASRRPVRLVALWRYANQSDALKAELAFKKHSRNQKLTHLKSQDSFRNGEFIHGNL